MNALSVLPVALVAGGVGLGACASAGTAGRPLEDAGAEAARMQAATEAGVPYRIRFRWEYGDAQGRLRGDGLARINPPDSFRLDLFSTGEGSMAATLADDSLGTLGEMEDVELPLPAFLYGMAGVFRPDSELRLVGGERSETGATLSYEAAGGRRAEFRFEGDRLIAIEERMPGRAPVRLRVSWGESGPWPASAEFRDPEAPRRVRWELDEVAEEPAGFPRSIFELTTGG